jgi:hypothetical protein
MSDRANIRVLDCKHRCIRDIVDAKSRILRIEREKPQRQNENLHEKDVDESWKREASCVDYPTQYQRHGQDEIAYERHHHFVEQVLDRLVLAMCELLRRRFPLALIFILHGSDEFSLTVY